jgi:hypothetical protein
MQMEKSVPALDKSTLASVSIYATSGNIFCTGVLQFMSQLPSKGTSKGAKQHKPNIIFPSPFAFLLRNRHNIVHFLLPVSGSASKQFACKRDLELIEIGLIN